METAGGLLNASLFFILTKKNLLFDQGGNTPSENCITQPPLQLGVDMWLTGVSGYRWQLPSGGLHGKCLQKGANSVCKFLWPFPLPI